MLLPITAVAMLALPPADAAPAQLGNVGPASVTFDESAGLAGIEVTVDEVTFRPFAGASAPDLEGGASIPLRVEPHVHPGGGNSPDVLTLRISSPTGNSSGIDPGLCEGLGEWRRLDLSRYSEPYGQTWWPKTTYSVEGDFWFTAHWVIEESDGTKWSASNQASRGTEPFPAALAIEYAPDTEGACLPIHEALEIRISRDLWEVVPGPKQGNSEYRGFLQDAVFIDLWGPNKAAELRHFLQVIQAVSRGKQQHYTILQNWSAGGWDSLLPDSMWLPDYPPNPGVGTVEELREVCELGKSMGRFGFRTNYRILREWSPSYQRGFAHFAVDSDGKPLDYLRPADWLAHALRADTEIRDILDPNACFTDQMTSGASPAAWHDYAADGGTRSMRKTLQGQAQLARQMKETFGGPLGSESLADQHLLGRYVDTGDYDVKNGHNRLFSPEYKLRRLHGKSGFHGMGLMYRFYEMPPFKAFHSGTTTFGDDPEQLDDYRCCEIMYGNGGYLCHGFANWRYWLTEILLVGNLQKHYTRMEARDVRYWHEGEWVTLQELVESGTVPNIVPWNPQTEAYGRVKTEYAGQLTVITNRLPGPLTVRLPPGVGSELTLPQYGWVAYKPDASVLAFSAYWPDTEHRADYLNDEGADLRFIDPRGEEILGVGQMTLWEEGEVTLVADLDAGTVTVGGQTLDLDRPQPEPLTSIEFGFANSLDGWQIIRGVLTAEPQPEFLRLTLVAPGAYMHSPPMRIEADSMASIELRMRVGAKDAKPGGLYYTTEASPGYWSDKLRNFEVIADGEFRTYRLDMSTSPNWPGQVITGLRLDPVRGAAAGTVDVDFLRAVGK